MIKFLVMTKKEIIIKAWMDLNIETPFGICDKTGWVHGYFCNGIDDIINDYGDITDKIDYEIEYGGVGKFRPKSLHGIENNNGGLVKIESEEDLPKICTYDMSKFKLMYWTNGGQYEATDYKKWILHYSHLKITHYQFIPIVKLNEPLY